MSRKRKKLVSPATRRARADHQRQNRTVNGTELVCEACGLRQPFRTSSGDRVQPCRCGHLYARYAA
jgi:hypothetical protein